MHLDVRVMAGDYLIFNQGFPANLVGPAGDPARVTIWGIYLPDPSGVPVAASRSHEEVRVGGPVGGPGSVTGSLDVIAWTIGKKRGNRGSSHQATITG
jgi:hypothetical protein